MEILEFFKDLQFTNVFWQILTPLLFSFADIITGYIQAVINHNVDSQKMRTGLLHKVLILLVICLGFIIQVSFNISYLANFICIYVIVMEVVSIIENLKKAGVEIGKLSDIIKDKPDETPQESLTKLTETIENKEDKK